MYNFVAFRQKQYAQTIEKPIFGENFVKKNLQKEVKGVQKEDNLVAKKAIRTNAFRPLLTYYLFHILYIYT